jgi:hypothetical protein
MMTSATTALTLPFTSILNMMKTRAGCVGAFPLSSETYIDFPARAKFWEILYDTLSNLPY